MAYPTLIPVTDDLDELPAALDGQVNLKYSSGADVYVDGGNGVYCLIQRFEGVWRQYGPEWTLPATDGGGDVARMAVPKNIDAVYHVRRKSGDGSEGEMAMIIGVDRG